MKGKVFIHKSLCKACCYCIEACPKKLLKLAPYFNEKGFHPVEIIDESSCIGCGMCYQVCPEIAIEVERHEKIQKR
jgi:2-oxoglutarate ferredoxin oxidoreductase subunit delta